MKIVTHYIFPPIPDRRFDWCATYEADDGDTGQRGWGRTEEEAKADLVTNWPREKQ